MGSEAGGSALARANTVPKLGRGGVLFTAEQLSRHRRVCSWCTLTAALLIATVPVAVPEARAAYPTLRQQRGASTS